MQLIGGVPYISYAELVQYGVSENTIRRGCYRAQKNLSLNVPNGNNWQNLPDPTDRRRVLIRLDSIPARTRTKYNIPTAEEAREQLAAQRHEAEQQRQALHEHEREAAITQAVQEGYLSWMPLYTQPHRYTERGQPQEHPGYPQAQARELARAAAVAEAALARVFASARADHKEAQALLPIVQAANLRYLKLKNKRYFVEKLRACQKDGILTTIRPPREGERNGFRQNHKFDVRQQFLAEFFYSLPAGLTAYQVWQRVQYKCEATGLPRAKAGSRTTSTSPRSRRVAPPAATARPSTSSSSAATSRAGWRFSRATAGWRTAPS
jgi:hypothetical protein